MQEATPRRLKLSCRGHRGIIAWNPSSFLLPGPATSDATTQPTFEVNVPAPELSKGEREYQAFLRLLPGLLPTHRGRYVAVHNGQVVDADTDDIALVRRVHARIGSVPIHVGLVTEQPPVVRVPHYHEQGRGEGT
jgi:hypothetical protein